MVDAPTATPPNPDDGVTALGIAAPEAPVPAAPPPPSDATPPAETPPATPPPATPPPATPPAAAAITADKLTIPARSPFTQIDLEAAAAEGEASGLSLEQTQRMLDARAEVIAGLRVQWFADAQADPEIGGLKFPQAVQDAQTGVMWLFPKEQERNEMQDWFNKTALGNHPGFIRAMARIGAALREDRPVSPQSGGGVGTDRKSSVDVLWPSKT